MNGDPFSEQSLPRDRIQAIKNMRLAALWIEMNGFWNSCLREIASRPSVELFLAHRPGESDAPFDHGQFSWIERQLWWRSSSDLDVLDRMLEEFHPDVIVLAGWAVPAYRKVASRWKNRALRIMTMDNCWLGTPRQWIASVAGRNMVHGIADAVWVPGERQAIFAKRLHFKQSRILRGLISCDYSAFAELHESRIQQGQALNRAFIFIGRMVERKGIATLLAGYQLYRRRVAQPWPLVCYGRGPLASLLADNPGIVLGGFIQPDELPKKMAEAACLILPSDFEAWAVVVHEAAAAGRLIIVSDAVGSGPHLVQDNYNGYVFGANDAEELARLMERIGSFSDDKLNAMSAASFSLAQQFTPVRWADTLLEFVERSTQSCIHA